ncbi:MAG: sugar kinase [Alphaproteobacteria bacterium]|nr:sugar kinase [Alphaproteobacteria bacterium]
MSRILGVGAASLTTILRVERIPATPTKVLAKDCIVLGDGMSASAVCAAARLGAKAAWLGRLGQDATGDRILADLTLAGVDVGQVRRAPEGRSSVSSVIVDAKGERLVVPFHDPALDPDPAWLPEAAIAGADAVLVDVRWVEGAARALEIARATGRIAMLDGELTAPGILERLMPLATHVVFSEAGLGLAYGGDLVAAARALQGFVGVTRGPRGFAWIENGRARESPGFAVEAVDTLGAGDVFHGAFALGLVEGMDIARAARFANAAAAIKCSRFGGRLGAPDRAQVEALLQIRPDS